MLEACVEVSLLLKTNDFLKVRMINMGIYPEQALEYRLHNLPKVGRKRCTYNNKNKQ